MAKRPTTKPQTHSWAIYHIRGTPAQFVGIVYDQPDEEAAIKAAIEEYTGKYARQADGTAKELIAIKPV